MTTTLPAHSFVSGEINELLSACTRCGRCVEVCPVVPLGAAATQPASAVVANAAAFMLGQQALEEPASDWIHACHGCGLCLPACPENVNPRRMLMLANIRDAERESRTPQLFRRMARAVKLMIAMQVVPAEFSRLFMPPTPRQAEVIFYVGCNALRTPHLLFNSMYVLDALGVDYEVLGGPSSCCGVIATKWEGQLAAGGKVTSNTLSRMEGFGGAKVLNWCPTCDIHLNETMGGFRSRRFEFDHLTDYFVQRGDELQRLFTQALPRRVVLHAHAGLPQVGRNVEALLRSIPGLEVLETVLESSYTCGGSGCGKAPELRDREHAHLLERVKASGADTLVTLYHGCHMAFMGHEEPGTLDVLNFTDLLAQALGLAPHVDQLKHYRLLEDWKAVVEEAQPLLKANGLHIDADWLQAHAAEIFSVAEFRGGLDCFNDSHSSAHT